MRKKYSHGAKKYKRPEIIIVIIGLTLIYGGFQTVKHINGLHNKHTQKSVQGTVHISVTKHKAGINFALPIRLQIPKILVDSQIKYVGLTKNGNMSMPVNVYDVGWYKFGALPGNIGTAVIAGHLDGYQGQSGEFSKLIKLVKNDIIIVTESNGQTVTFVVRDTRNYPQYAQPDEVFKSTSGSHLNLITCTGSWDSAEQSFAQRLVVFADKEP